MIAFLSNWLKEIVLLILIATFMDLLLPNRSMERYVKLVMGLVIILAILTPIISLLNKNVDLSKLSLTDGNLVPGEMTSLESIHASGEELKKTQDRLVIEETERRIAEQIATEINEEFEVSVLEKYVVMEAATDKRMGIEQVNLTISSKNGMEDSQPIQPVTLVEPIVIDSTSDSPPSLSKGESQQQSELAQKISGYLQKQWELQPNQIVIQIVEEP